MKLSLKNKTILLIASIGMLIGLIAILICYNGIHNTIIQQYTKEAMNYSRAAAAEVDKEKVASLKQAVMDIYNNTENKVYSDQWGTTEFEEYISRYSEIEKREDFQAVREQLRRLQDVLDVECLYLVCIDKERDSTIYLCDAAYEDVCPPGCMDPLYTDAITSDMTEADKYDIYATPNITNTQEYGWLIATGSQIYGEDGSIIAAAAVDISMNTIMAEQNKYLFTAIIILVLLAVLVCLIGAILADRTVVRPINILSERASQYVVTKKSFANLNIRSNDEIGILAKSMIRMEEEINGYITSLVSAREHAERMDQAANIDPMTMVRNKRAYETDMVRINADLKEYAVAMIDLNYLKKINDSYGHEKGDIAIKSLCSTICRVFKHSAVYRVGGDEFVAILENDDYLDRERLAALFRETIQKLQEDESLPEWERISAAIGYAVYDPKIDGDVNSVLKRADKAMYKNKRAMKAERE